MKPLSIGLRFDYTILLLPQRVGADSEHCNCSLSLFFDLWLHCVSSIWIFLTLCKESFTILFQILLLREFYSIFTLESYSVRCCHFGWWRPGKSHFNSVHLFLVWEFIQYQRNHLFQINYHSYYLVVVDETVREQFCISNHENSVQEIKPTLSVLRKKNFSIRIGLPWDNRKV